MGDTLRTLVEHPPTRVAVPFPKVLGWSGALVQQLLLELVTAGVRLGGGYMEVGTYYGRTLISAAQSGAPCVGIDDFSQTGLGIRIEPDLLHGECLANIRRHAPHPERVRLLREPWERVFARPCGAPAAFWTRDEPRPHVPPCSVFFYDGDHARVPTMGALRLVQPFLVDGAVVVVDDISGFGVLQAVRDAYEAEERYRWLHTIENPPGMEPSEGWWNGLAVMGWHS